MSDDVKNMTAGLVSEDNSLFYSRAIIVKIFEDDIINFQSKLDLGLVDAGAVDDFDYINKCIEREGKLPSVALFIAKFSWDFDDYRFSDVSFGELVEALRNARKVAELLRTADTWKQLDLMDSSADTLITFLHGALERLDKFDDFGVYDYSDDTFSDTLERRNDDETLFASSGFAEIDKDINGFSLKDGDFVLVTARTNSGKSWFLLKSAWASAQRGLRVGFISPEMSRMDVQYRLDAINFGVRLSGIYKGDLSDDALSVYKQQRESLSKSDMVLKIATKKSFRGSITVNKIRSFCERFDIQVLYIDGLSLLSVLDKSQRMNEAERLTKLAEDLHTLMEMRSMVIVFAIQSNRDGFRENADKVPSLLNVRGSDGPGQNATLGFSIKFDRELHQYCISIEKNRRFDAFGKYTYTTDLDKGVFTYAGGGQTPVVKVSKKSDGKEAPKKSCYRHIESDSNGNEDYF